MTHGHTFSLCRPPRRSTLAGSSLPKVSRVGVVSMNVCSPSRPSKLVRWPSVPSAVITGSANPNWLSSTFVMEFLCFDEGAGDPLSTVTLIVDRLSREVLRIPSPDWVSRSLPSLRSISRPSKLIEQSFGPSPVIASPDTSKSLELYFCRCPQVRLSWLESYLNPMVRCIKLVTVHIFQAVTSLQESAV